MTDLPRLLAIMGSGETAPTMAKVHRALLERVGPPPIPAVLLDTPYGFQENADELSARTQGYFESSIGAPITVASWRSEEDGPLARETALTRVRDARYVFAGPGSPSYALSLWRGSGLPDALRERLAVGGCVTFASAAALTLGTAAVPVYEIYKVGADPQWLEGLDVLSAVGLRAAVIPHYDNAEGGTHDTRFCYLGERRLAVMERLLDPEAFVLGVDEHTACVLDLEAGTAAVVGRGGVTVRRAGRSTVFDAGTTVSIEELRGAAAGGTGAAGRPAAPSTQPQEAVGPRSPLPEEAARLEAAFTRALAERRVEAAVAALLELEEGVTSWSPDPTQSQDAARARALLRGMVVRLGEVAVDGARDPREVLAPFVQALLDARENARDRRDFTLADGLRDRLTAAGVEVRDTPDGSHWSL